MPAHAERVSQMGSQRMSTSEEDCAGPVEIFLGGSCNPTTWRTEISMPILEVNDADFNAVRTLMYAV